MTRGAAVPLHLVSLCNLIRRSYGSEVDRHEYEGLILFLYPELSDENLAIALSYFVDRDHFLIKNDIAIFCTASPLEYQDVKDRLSECGFVEWVNEDLRDSES